jgi:glycosyltransferase involved in cell wall biosynthesis
LQQSLLYFNPSTVGGLADYAHEQANALVASGIPVVMLVAAQRPPRANSQYQTCPALNDAPNNAQSKLARRISWVKGVLGNYRALAGEIQKGNYKAVLMGSYSEYLAPLWAGQFRSLAGAGVKFGAIVHDPVRDYVVGPQWWHRRSIAAAYSFLREAFVHEEIQLDTVCPMPDLRTTVVPHGPFRFPDPTESREQARKKLTLPDNAFVLLSFGHIRDGKNLDLTIRALADFPQAWLVVAGKEQSSGQKPVTYYQELAQKLGVSERCRWIHGHVPENEIGNLFIASDLILLTYSKDFRSASGVLNTAVRYRKPCVASSGGGNLQSVVERYGLGCFVAPDNLDALKAGIGKAMREKINPRWDTYEAENSWQRNAQLVREKMFGSTSGR